MRDKPAVADWFLLCRSITETPSSLFVGLSLPLQAKRGQIGVPRGNRVAVITYAQGQRAGIYTFTAGRLSSIERGPEAEAPQPKTPKSKAKKKPAAT